MLRIEILFEREAVKKMPAGTLHALSEEVERRLVDSYPEIWLRIDKSTQPSVKVSGSVNDKEKARVMAMLEEIWQDDAWFPAA